MQLKEWFGGSVIHIHTRLENKSAEYQPGEEIQFTLSGLSEYARRFSGNGYMVVVDTDHAALSIHPNWALDQRQEYFFPQNTEKTVKQISEDVRTRAKKIRESESSHVLTGTETDILNSSGMLDVNNDVLSSLDLVIASFHYYPWAANNFVGGEKKHIDLKEILMAYERVAANPHVDVIGHPTTYIQKYNRDVALLPEWEPLFRIMKMAGTAFELNLSTLLRIKEPEEFDLKVIGLAAEHGVNFLLGLDLHNLKMFGSELKSDFVIDEQSAARAFDKNVGKANMNFFYSLKGLIKLLKANGLTREMIVNSSDEKFNKWLESRK